ncbi:MAG: carboxylating nicotinate-nucleotide diphosphorylase [Planctomycetota bacterium]
MFFTDDETLILLIALAIREDLGTGDITSSLLPNPDAETTFKVTVKQPGVFSGKEIAQAILNAYDPSITIEWYPSLQDGSIISNVPAPVATLQGSLSKILAAERVLLNFLQHLSGIATLTRKFVDAVFGTSAKIFDTRKTTPGWRNLEKYAVRCGGGNNHRVGLYDGVLIKENHISLGDEKRLGIRVFEMLSQLENRKNKVGPIVVEARTLDHVEQLLSVIGIDVILLDNMSFVQLREAVELRDGYGLRGKVELEASGGVTLNTVRVIAETGVDRISVGSITHSAPALDISLERG